MARSTSSCERTTCWPSSITRDDKQELTAVYPSCPSSEGRSKVIAEPTAER
jgi:hypothetical protein